MDEKAQPSQTQRYRTLQGVWYWFFIALVIIGTFLAINHMFYLRFFVNVALFGKAYLYLLLGCFLSFTFLMYPANKKAPRGRVPWYDILLCLISMAAFSFLALNAIKIHQLGLEFHAPLPLLVTSGILWLLVLEAVRRSAGLALLVVVLVFSTYPMYAKYMPVIVSGFAFTFWETTSYHVLSADSLIGLPMRIFGSLFFGFIVFGVTLERTGGGRFFLNLAYALLGRRRGGPAKVAIVSSGLLGSLSGSVVSNVITTGSITIPAMKRLGFDPPSAGAIEACASTGAVLMPPVMGATAFVMASILGIPYLWVALAAAVPSLLYYYSLFIGIDAYAALHELKGLPKEEIPSLRRTLKEGWVYVFGLVLLVFLLVQRLEGQAPFLATAAILVFVNFRKETRFNFHLFLDFIISAGRLLMDLVVILASVGFIVGALSMTGLGGTLTSDIVRLAGGNVYIMLFTGAAACFLLGMGMTVTAAYIFLAIVFAPVLIAAGFNPMAVHLFVLYWAMISYLTPPVALGVQAAAVISGSSFLKTALESLRFGLCIFILPFLFVLQPQLLLQDLSAVPFLVAVSTCVVGFWLISSGSFGYFIGIGTLRGSKFYLPIRFLLFVSGVLIALPYWQSKTAGALFGAVAVGFCILFKKKWRPEKVSLSEKEVG